MRDVADKEKVRESKIKTGSGEKRLKGMKSQT